jgi:hypothetical protein
MNPKEVRLDDIPRNYKITAVILIIVFILVIVGALTWGTIKLLKVENSESNRIMEPQGRDKDLFPLNTYAGMYNGKTITIYPYKIESYEDYLIVAKHEWAHYYYDKVNYKGFLAEWNRAVKNCSIETTYASNFSSKELRSKEEFAECWAVAKCCEKKEWIITRSGG